jgi:hypothetical protein
MSATYNWAYKPGINNKYGFVVSSSDDGTKPDNCCYLALFGNDDTGNGSRLYPYRTFKRAAPISGGAIIIGSGVYREGKVSGLDGLTLIGDGDVIIDSSYFDYFAENTGLLHANSMTFKGDGGPVTSNGAGCNFFGTDCAFYNCIIASDQSLRGGYTNCIFTQAAYMTMDANMVIVNTTFYMCYNINVANQFVNLRSVIFSNCNINFTLATDYPIYSLFYQCNFGFNSSGSSGGALYPDVPPGFTYISDIQTLRSNYTAAYPTMSTPFANCIIADPLFNNPAINDFTLQFSSPAKIQSYFGTYVGAKSIAFPIKASTAESSGGFEFSSAVNLQIAEDSITLTDPASNGQIDTKVIVNSQARELVNLPSYNINGDRNGQYVDSISDLGNISGVGDPLSFPFSYIVESGAIVYNGASYQPGDCFTTVMGQSTFTSVASGVVREITEAPQRHTIMARFSDGGSLIAAGTALVINNYYYVQSGSVSYESMNYNSGAVFKADSTNAFSGSGSVIIAFSTENYQHYEPGRQPTSNNVNDSRMGVIVRGNGDPAYVRGGMGITEFPINAKFIQLRFIIAVNNLKS